LIAATTAVRNSARYVPALADKCLAQGIVDVKTLLNVAGPCSSALPCPY
jgi:hypothetical protein